MTIPADKSQAPGCTRASGGAAERRPELHGSKRGALAIPYGVSRRVALLCCLLAMLSPYRRMRAEEPQHAIVLDRVVADVDGQAILASDVDDEMRFSALQPGFEPPSDNTPQKALDRVIDRTLIDQQRVLQPGVAEISQKEVDKAVADLRKEMPVTAKVDCETDAGWRSFLAQHGFTPAEIQSRMQERLAILKFIDLRFGVAAQVSIGDVRTYYEQVLVPELKKNNAAVPNLGAVASRIREILRQQQVSSMIDAWLKNLRAEGQVKILDPAYEQAGGDGKGGQ